LLKDELISPSTQSQTTPANIGGLNPRYTFDNFIVGSSNDLAYTASRAVASTLELNITQFISMVVLALVKPT